VSRTSATVGTGRFQATVFGTNLAAGTVPGAAPHPAPNSEEAASAAAGCRFCGTGNPLPTVQVSSTRLEATVPNYWTPSAGTLSVDVGGSERFVECDPLPVAVANPKPTISELILRP